MTATLKFSASSLTGKPASIPTPVPASRMVADALKSPTPLGRVGSSTAAPTGGAATTTASRFLVIRTNEGVAHSLELQPGHAYRVGRSAANDVTLKDMQVSSYHARLDPDRDEFIVRDLESRNGTSVNGERVKSRRLRPGDRLRLGTTDVLYVNRLDPAELGTSALLSPRLSQPLLRTEVQRLRDLIGQLTTAQQQLGAKAPNDAIRHIGGDIARVAGELWKVESHLRSLICANHFHQLFHHPRSMSELYHDMLRYIGSAIDADNAALVLLNGQKASIAATIGIATLNWQFRLPDVFQFLIGRVMKENERYFTPSLGAEPTIRERFATSVPEADRRSVLIVPLVLPESGRVIGAVYFDNVHAPGSLRPTASELAEGCLAIFAGYRENEAVSGTQQRRRVDVMAAINQEASGPTLCSD